MAVCEAIRMGYSTRERLLAALPMFSLNRLVNVLDLLITADMVQIHAGVLGVSEDMRVVEALAGEAFELPVDADALLRDTPLRHHVFNGLGIHNAPGAEALLRYEVRESTRG